jgi:carboxyl-terminal processing protease
MNSKNKWSKIAWVYSLAVLFLLFSGSSKLNAQLKEENSLSCVYIHSIQKLYLDQHFSIHEADDKIRDRVIDQYIKRLDPTKIFFTQADVDTVKKEMSNAFNQLKERTCPFLDKVQTLYVAKVKERVDFAKKTLDAKFKIDEKTEFEFDPDKKPYPKTVEELNEFLKKYITFQVSNYVMTDMKLDEAKATVIRNYERLQKRTEEKKKSDIVADYLDSFARALDPHSSFFSREVEEDFDIQMSLSLEGIGATLSSQDGFTVVEALVPGGAAARSGLIQPQDKIIAVGQGASGKVENVIEMELRDVVSRIRGKKGTKVKLLILRKVGDKKEKSEVVLERDKIKLEDEAVSIHYIERVIDGKKRVLGLLNMPSFYAGGGRSSAADMKKVIVEAVAKKVDGIVLDLSTNGGGSLDDAVKIAGLFFKTGNVVKQTSRDVYRGEVPLADVDPTVDFSGPLIVLTSRISASASEIVSGTLQDYKRGIIVGGNHTFGKGSIQTVVRIPQDLGALKVTVGMFFTPGGNSTQHRGVEADIILPSLWSSEEIGEKSLDYSLPPKKIDSFISKEAFVKEGVGTWKQIEPSWVKTLKERSEKRIGKDADFKKINEDFAKAQKTGKIIKISEVLNNKSSKDKEKEKSKRYAPKDEKEKEYLGRADIKESLNILSELVALENGWKLAN